MKVWALSLAAWSEGVQVRKTAPSPWCFTSETSLELLDCRKSAKRLDLQAGQFESCCDQTLAGLCKSLPLATLASTDCNERVGGRPRSSPPALAVPIWRSEPSKCSGSIWHPPMCTRRLSWEVLAETELNFRLLCYEHSQSGQKYRLYNIHSFHILRHKMFEMSSEVVPLFLRPEDRRLLRNSVRAKLINCRNTHCSNSNAREL